MSYLIREKGVESIIMVGTVVIVVVVVVVGTLVVAVVVEL